MDRDDRDGCRFLKDSKRLAKSSLQLSGGLETVHSLGKPPSAGDSCWRSSSFRLDASLSANLI